MPESKKIPEAGQFRTRQEEKSGNFRESAFAFKNLRGGEIVWVESKKGWTKCKVMVEDGKVRVIDTREKGLVDEYYNNAKEWKKAIKKDRLKTAEPNTGQEQQTPEKREESRDPGEGEETPEKQATGDREEKQEKEVEEREEKKIQESEEVEKDDEKKSRAGPRRTVAKRPRGHRPRPKREGLEEADERERQKREKAVKQWFESELKPKLEIQYFQQKDGGTRHYKQLRFAFKVRTEQGKELSLGKYKKEVLDNMVLSDEELLRDAEMSHDEFIDILTEYIDRYWREIKKREEPEKIKQERKEEQRQKKQTTEREKKEPDSKKEPEEEAQKIPEYKEPAGTRLFHVESALTLSPPEEVEEEFFQVKARLLRQLSREFDTPAAKLPLLDGDRPVSMEAQELADKLYRLAQGGREEEKIAVVETQVQDEAAQLLEIQLQNKEKSKERFMDNKTAMINAYHVLKQKLEQADNPRRGMANLIKQQMDKVGLYLVFFKYKNTDKLPAVKLNHFADDFLTLSEECAQILQIPIESTPKPEAPSTESGQIKVEAKEPETPMPDEPEREDREDREYNMEVLEDFLKKKHNDLQKLKKKARKKSEWIRPAKQKKKRRKYVEAIHEYGQTIQEAKQQARKIAAYDPEQGNRILRQIEQYHEQEYLSEFLPEAQGLEQVTEVTDDMIVEEREIDEAASEKEKITSREKLAAAWQRLGKQNIDKLIRMEIPRKADKIFDQAFNFLQQEAKRLKHPAKKVFNIRNLIISALLVGGGMVVSSDTSRRKELEKQEQQIGKVIDEPKKAPPLSKIEPEPVREEQKTTEIEPEKPSVEAISEPEESVDYTKIYNHIEKEKLDKMLEIREKALEWLRAGDILTDGRGREVIQRAREKLSSDDILWENYRIMEENPGIEDVLLSHFDDGLSEKDKYYILIRWWGLTPAEATAAIDKIYLDPAKNYYYVLDEEILPAREKPGFRAIRVYRDGENYFIYSLNFRFSINESGELLVYTGPDDTDGTLCYQDYIDEKNELNLYIEKDGKAVRINQEPIKLRNF